MRSIKVVATSSCALAALFVGSGIAAADDTSVPTSTIPVVPPVAVAESTITLPLFGTPLIVDVTTDAGGGLVDVSLNQADEFTTTQVKPNRVKFVNTDGTVSVKVSARRGGERVEARAGQLADISGPGGWSGDVFDTGDATTVAFTVSAGADGGPDITGVTVNSVADFVIGATSRGTEADDGDDDDDGDELKQWATVKIDFSFNGQTRSLRISSTLKTDDGETRAKLSISLSRLKGRQLADGPAVGPHTWTGSLCDGTEATVTYAVSAEGQISDVVSNVPAEVNTDENRASVHFADSGRISIKVRGEGETLTVGVSEKFRCDRVDPTVNGSAVPTTIATDDDDDDDDDGDRHGDRHGDRDGDRDDGRNRDDNNNDDEGGDRDSD